MESRLNNPNNLMNRLRNGLTAPVKKTQAMDLFIKREDSSSVNNSVNPASIPSVQIPATIPLPEESSSFVDDHIDDADAKIKLGAAHNDALDLLSASIASLKGKVTAGEVHAKSLPAVIASASRVVSDIRKERLEREKNNKTENVHYHFYTPTQKKIEEYEIIDVAG